MRGYLTTHQDKTVAVNLRTCKQPSMSEHRGRTWDHGYIILEGEKIYAWLDTTWGEYIYFEYEGRWYKVKMFSETPWDQTTDYDIDPFDINTQEIKLKKDE